MASTSSQKQPPPIGIPGKSSSSKKKKSKDGGVSSDEERWLDALESGKLEEMDDELKKIKPKDPKLMTARQRAMYERGSDKDPNPGEEKLMALPSGYKEKVIAFICGLIVIILMIMGLASTDWLMAAGWRQGLFMHCIEENAQQPLPFNMQQAAGCFQSRDAAYIRAAAALCIITLVTDLVATVLTGLGLRTKDHHTKYKYYRFAVIVMGLALVSVLIALVIYPVCFAAELNLGNRTVWEFGWAYGVGWGAAIFLFGGVVLLLCDKESEEIYYKERKIVHESDTRA